MYEHLRNEFTMNLAKTYGRDQITEIASMLDKVVINYDISEKSTELAVIEDVIPQEMKIYLAAKKLDGLSELTLKNYYCKLYNFFLAVRKPPADITTNDIRMYLVTYQTQRKISDRSLESIRMTISYFFSWLVDEDYLVKNPCRTIKPIKYEKKPRKPLTRYQLEKLRLIARDKRDLAIIDVLYSTGCRIAELSNMKLSDIDPRYNSIHIVGKGRKHHDVFLNERALLSLQDYLESRQGDSEYLFVGSRKPYGKLSTRGLQKILRPYQEQLGCKFSAHVMRHTTATLALRSGMKITEVQQMLDHANVSTTQIYAETMQDDVIQAHRKYVV